jgi:hypothetical protein
MLPIPGAPSCEPIFADADPLLLQLMLPRLLLMQTLVVPGRAVTPRAFANCNCDSKSNCNRVAYANAQSRTPFTVTFQEADCCLVRNCYAANQERAQGLSPHDSNQLHVPPADLAAHMTVLPWSHMRPVLHQRNTIAPSMPVVVVQSMQYRRSDGRSPYAGYSSFAHRTELAHVQLMRCRSLCAWPAACSTNNESLSAQRRNLPLNPPVVTSTLTPKSLRVLGVGPDSCSTQQPALTPQSAHPAAVFL